MPFALVTIGLLLVITGFQDTYKQTGAQVAKDFTGSGNFVYWLIAIGVVGAIGYNKTLQPFSRALMALLIIVIFLSNKGFFAQLNPAIQTGTSTQPLPAGGGVPISVSSGGSGGGNNNSGTFFDEFSKSFAETLLSTL